MIRRTCCKCNIEKDIINFHKSGKTKNGLIKYKFTCKECRPIVEKDYRKKYRELNKDSIRDYNRKYESDRKSVDVVFKFKRNIRTLLCQSFNSRGFKKNTKTEKLLGCTIVELFSYIESLFKDDMNWGNRNNWCIDHIVPLATANTIEDVIKLNHYTNLQPLWCWDNSDKRQTDKKLWGF
jgi:hypothetical protein